jgi:hypothetical protein
MSEQKHGQNGRFQTDHLAACLPASYVIHHRRLRQESAVRSESRKRTSGLYAYSLLYSIGRDCVGALQFVPGTEAVDPGQPISGETLDESGIEDLLNNLVKTPLGLDGSHGVRTCCSLCRWSKVAPGPVLS